MAQVAQKSMKTKASVKTPMMKPLSVKSESPIRESVKKEPVKITYASREKVLEAIEASREKNQPVLDYLKDK